VRIDHTPSFNLVQVLRVSDDSVLVDPGFYGLTEIPKSKLSLSQLHTEDGQIPKDRSSACDIRSGDILSVRVDSLFTPYGDMQLETVEFDPLLRSNAVWKELAAARASRTPVMGRVLNACTGGYAVGVAGLIALLPYGRFTVRTITAVGVLQPFLVEVADMNRGLLTVADVQKGSSKRLF
jgi:ribosomal protein S1